MLGIGDRSNTRLEILDLNDILSHITAPHTPPVTIRFEGDIIRRNDVGTGKKSVIGHINAESLVKLAKDHKNTLFLENPRKAMGKSAPTHKAILNTLAEDAGRNMFWKLNNGITATCSRLDKGKDDGTYTADNLKIVNGRQTVYTLENAIFVDGVSLLMTIHEAVNDWERNMISEATNTQNPVKPVDMVSNYPEMVEMVLQCRKDFGDFYFERQTNGFNSAPQAVKNRVTKRRVLGKNPTARAYYAYEIDPNDAMMPDNVLFSVTSSPNYYDKIFKDRKIRELIIPHIFMSMLDELHGKWCQKSEGDIDLAAIRNKGIISKDIVKYYILRFIAKTMTGIGEEDRSLIKDSMIEKFRALDRKDPVQEEFLEVAQAAYDEFITIFDLAKNDTWPSEVLEKIKNVKGEIREGDKPAPLDIMYRLKEHGNSLLPILLMNRNNVSRQLGDKVGEKLLALAYSKHE